MGAHELTSDFYWLLDAPLQELYDYRQRSLRNPVHLAYAEAMIGYLSADHERLELAIQDLRKITASSSTFAQAATASFALDLARLRCEIRLRDVGRKTLSGILWKLNTQAEVLKPWSGEAYCLLGRACEILDRHDQAMRYYRKAHLILESQGCRKKSIRSLMNHLASRSRLASEDNYISEYFEIVRMARQAQEFGIAGVALMNISRELQAAGALPSALRYANRALLFMSRDVGTLHYYLALVHRSHLHLELGRDAEARLDLENAKLSSHREIQAAVAHLESRKVAVSDLTVGWRARILKAPRKESNLASMENELVRLLSTGPRRKAELIALLWGDREDALSLDFRFKDLLKRIRRKREHLVAFDGENYRLSPKSFIELADAPSRLSG